LTPPRRARRRIAGLVIPEYTSKDAVVVEDEASSRHTLDVVTKDLAVTFSAALAETFSTLSAARHYVIEGWLSEEEELL
jgi:hypothetical protein